MIELEGCEVDLTAGQVRRAGVVHPLTEHEIGLLAYLAARPSQAVAREVLLAEVWGYAPTVRSRAVDQTIKRLRPKLEVDPSSPRHLVTVHGVGYRLEGLKPPSPTDRFVGRASALARLTEVHQAHRWVTVLGPGGMGKTRLVREWRRGTWVELEATRTRNEVVRAVAAAVGVPPLRRDEALDDALTRALERTSTTLLVLDNVEQVTEVVRALGDAWLDRHQTLKVVATSRHRVEVRGEAILELAPLGVEAGRELLLARVEQVGGQWTDGPAIDAVVRALDGIPLAIELAAARGRLLSPDRLQARLTASVDILRSSRRGRHGALRTALTWSWNLLDDAEQRTLAALTIFPAAFTVEAAEWVLDDPETLDRLQLLRDRSWIRQDGDRLTLLRPIRVFAATHRTDSVALEERHAEWVVSKARGAQQPVTAPGWVVEPPMEPWTADLQAAFERTGTRRPDLAAEAALHLHDAWQLRQSPHIRKRTLDQALAIAQDAELKGRLRLARGDDPATILAEIEPLPRSSLHVQVQLVHAQRLMVDGSPSDSAFALAEALATEVGPAARVQAIRIERAKAAAVAGRRSEAEAISSLGLASDEAQVRAASHYALGFIALEFGDLDGASAAFEAAIGDGERGMLVGLLGITAYARGDFERSRILLDESMAWTLKSGNPLFIAEDRLESAFLEHLQGRVPEAMVVYGEVRDALEQLGRGQRADAVAALEAVGAAQLGESDRARALIERLQRSARGPDAEHLLRAVRAFVDADVEALRSLMPGSRVPVMIRKVRRLAGLDW